MSLLLVLLGIYVLNSLVHKISSTFLLTLVRESTTLCSWRNLWKSRIKLASMGCP